MTSRELISKIIMHRQIHFNGSFDEMIIYYKNDGKGVQPEISLEDIETVKNLESSFDGEIITKYLSISQIDLINKSLQCYKMLKDAQKEQSSIQQLISSMILSEEHEPEKEINAIKNIGKKALPHLLCLFQSEYFASAFSPGYGLAPELGAKCIGLIGADEALPILFRRIGNVEHFVEDAIIEAIKKIGTLSENFLIRILNSEPFSEENKKAAFVLIHFKNSYTVAKSAFDILKNRNRPNDPNFLNYLTIISEGLVGTDLENDFYALSYKDCLPKLLREDIFDIKERRSMKAKN